VASAVALLLLELQVQVLLGLPNGEFMSLNCKTIAYADTQQTLNAERNCTI